MCIHTHLLIVLDPNPTGRFTVCWRATNRLWLPARYHALSAAARKAASICAQKQQSLFECCVLLRLPAWQTIDTNGATNWSLLQRMEGNRVNSTLFSRCNRGVYSGLCACWFWSKSTSCSYIYQSCLHHKQHTLPFIYLCSPLCVTDTIFTVCSSWMSHSKYLMCLAVISHSQLQWS
jgi:hypothetical protein